VGAAGRIAFFPARVAARASRDQLALAAEDVVAEVARMVDRAFASTLPEEIVRSAARHKVVERAARELVESGALDRAVDNALRSEQMRRAIREVVESPEMRAALARQTTGLAEELVGSARARAARLDDRLDRRQRVAPPPFAGIATRALAAAADAGLVLLVFISLSAAIALISTMVGTLRPAWLVGLLLGSGLTLIADIYFVLFWSGAGQTPGMRLMRLRLSARDGRPPSLGRAVVRAVGTLIAIVPFFAGYVPVLFDERRRALPDLLAGTEVVYEDPRRELESEAWAMLETG